MADINNKKSEIAATQAELEATQKQLNEANETVRALRAREATLQGKIADLNFQVCLRMKSSMLATPRARCSCGRVMLSFCK